MIWYVEFGCEKVVFIEDVDVVKQYDDWFCATSSERIKGTDAAGIGRRRSINNSIQIDNKLFQRRFEYSTAIDAMEMVSSKSIRDESPIGRKVDTPISSGRALFIEEVVGGDVMHGKSKAMIANDILPSILHEKSKEVISILNCPINMHEKSKQNSSNIYCRTLRRKFQYCHWLVMVHRAHAQGIDGICLPSMKNYDFVSFKERFMCNDNSILPVGTFDKQTFFFG